MRRRVLFILIGFLLATAGTASADIQIIANKSVPLESLSKDEIQDIFLGYKLQWQDNSRIRFVLNKNNELYGRFIRSFIGRSPSQYKAYWKNMVFTGRGVMPRGFDSTKSILKYVESTPGAISFVESGTAVTNVKTISLR